MNGPLISELPLWERHEQRVLAILRSALERLQTRIPQGNETALNRELYFCILDVNSQTKESGDPSWFEHPPVFEGRNPPTPDTEDTASERKIPDLQWGYIDHQASDPRRSARYFVIECKRLGVPSHAKRTNLHYVKNGIHRFIELEWQYGKDTATGAMIGYAETPTLEEIAVDVNGELKRLGVPTLDLPPETESPLTEMEHSLERPFEITPFRLVHLWIDISTTHTHLTPPVNPGK